jgi:hypothetical protein
MILLLDLMPMLDLDFLVEIWDILDVNSFLSQRIRDFFAWKLYLL